MSKEEQHELQLSQALRNLGIRAQLGYTRQGTARLILAELRKLGYQLTQVDQASIMRGATR